MKTWWLACIFATLATWLLSVTAQAQFAIVTLKLDTNRVAVGESTVLHVFAQIAAPQRIIAERIFSWNVDLLDSNGNAARSDFSRLLKPASDREPHTSSAGMVDGANRLGIYDTFLDRPGAGREAPVELFSVPIVGVAGGQAIFRVTAGSSSPGPSVDFVLSPAEGDQPLIGGSYEGATVNLEVIGNPPCHPRLDLRQESLATGERRVIISFAPCPAGEHVVEYRDSLTEGSWQPVAGAPHDSGLVTETISDSVRFYRLRVTAR